MNTTTTTSTTRALTGALTSAASLLAAAALVEATATAGVLVTVSGTDIDIQVPAHTGGQPARTQVVAAYARAVSAPVRRRRGGANTWIEAHGTIAGHPVHIWTVADQVAEQVVA
ncbi:hypothetical protein HCA58_11010 [Micromonospora sp. HNM0581]|uniref:hypothetical protein n=1 Tax=Micromonospora sp. HNM0581 TaxID=2716341 RepID=UPI00146D40A6|nr:hypothetical protein [Micromonospora sp. HNM0581]NLU78897.1 hypothetical protein [Micromonospora sp. HNM0581]